MVRELQDKGYLSPEEQALTAVLLALIEKFEDEHYSTSKAEPHAILRELMRARDLRPKDLYEVFGSKGTTSEVLHGKRAISKAAAKSLAKIFNVKVDLFL
jgi:antitoxin component HigA of HigAB toxin-antitoxin module